MPANFNMTVYYWAQGTFTDPLTDPPSVADVPARKLKTWLLLGNDFIQLEEGFIYRFGVDGALITGAGFTVTPLDLIAEDDGVTRFVYQVLAVSLYRDFSGQVVSWYVACTLFAVGPV